MFFALRRLLRKLRLRWLRRLLCRWMLLLMRLLIPSLIMAAALPLAAQGVYRAQVETSAGNFILEVHRDWSPHAADRFRELIQARYYDDSRFFRVVAGRWVQFGIAGDPKVAQAWRTRTIPDDELKQSNTLGYAGFSNTAPGTRSTQIYINLGDNSARNDREPAFAPFAKVVEGLDVVQKLYS